MDKHDFDPRYPLRRANLRSQIFIGVIYGIGTAAFVWAAVFRLTVYPGGLGDLFWGTSFLIIAAATFLTGIVIVIRVRRPFTPPPSELEEPGDRR